MQVQVDLLEKPVFGQIRDSAYSSRPPSFIKLKPRTSCLFDGPRDDCVEENSQRVGEKRFPRANFSPPDRLLDTPSNKSTPSFLRLFASWFAESFHRVLCFSVLLYLCRVGENKFSSAGCTRD